MNNEYNFSMFTNDPKLRTDYIEIFRGSKLNLIRVATGWDEIKLLATMLESLKLPVALVEVKDSRKDDTGFDVCEFIKDTSPKTVLFHRYYEDMSIKADYGLPVTAGIPELLKKLTKAFS